ncbi:MAG: porin [Betaproteobacteria bacterium]|nr:porin [Betaproteobacteria bacterium]
MNKNIKLAVAGAVLALSASTANAGIIIPAGEWTIDINGNVNAFGNYVKVKGPAQATGNGAIARGVAQSGHDNAVGINTGLLPGWLGFTGKTRQNDLDVEFTISMQPGVSNNTATGDGLIGGEYNAFGNRQTYVSFGDKSWGSIKLGKDLGIFASDAILNDMTLLGVGAMADGSLGGLTSNSIYNTTVGGIGTGYIYAAWKGQIAYTTPNFNGFQATVALTNPNQLPQASTQNSIFNSSSGDDPLTRTDIQQERFGLEAKASYSFAGDVLSGKVWVSGVNYDVNTSRTSGQNHTVTAGDIGVNVNGGNFGVTGYYYKGEGAGTTFLGNAGWDSSTNAKRDSDGGYLQATYKLPTATKIGVAYGVSNLDALPADTTLVDKNERWTIGAYHPLTKHLNLVAEFNDIESRTHNGVKSDQKQGSLGAILFF